MICTYQDHAEDEGETETSALVKTEQENLEPIIFPVKLHNMLNQIDKQGLSHVVSWAPHGRCFLVHKKNEFVSRILASWFRQSKFASFQRQLNLYGFKRITTGPDKGGYYHELFLRGKPFLCQRIERIKIKGSRPGRIKTYADAEPNFYRMRCLPQETADGGDLASTSASNKDRDRSSSEAEHAPDSRPSSPFLHEQEEEHNQQLFRQHQPQARLQKRSSDNNPEDGPEDIHADDFGFPFPGSCSRSMSFLSSAPQPVARSSDSGRLTPSTQRNIKTGNATSIVSSHARELSLMNASLHRKIEASGRANLTATREQNQQIMNSNPASLPPVQQHRYLDSSASSTLAPFFAAIQEQLAQQSVYGNTNDSLHTLSTDMFEMSNEFLSEYLPTAQMLTMEDLFGSPNPQQQLQQQQQQQHYHQQQPQRSRPVEASRQQRRSHSFDS